MKNNQGFIGIGLILAIIAVLVVVGGAYYLETKNDSVPSITVLSPNGGETYSASAGQPITVKWKSNNIGNNKVSIGLKNIDTGKEKFWEVVPNNGMTDIFPMNFYPDIFPFVNNKIKVVVCNVKLDLEHPSGNYTQDCSVSDYSDNSFTIQQTSSNSEESLTETFKNQPGAIKSKEWDGAEFLVDLLTNNSNWVPGGSEEFFINQNSKIRRLNVNNATIVKNCATQYKDSSYTSGFKSDLLSFTTYVQNKIDKAKTDSGVLGEFGYTAYFDINGTNITAIYEQCLP